MPNLWVAGSAAICPQKASDIDVFVLGYDGEMHDISPDPNQFKFLNITEDYEGAGVDPKHIITVTTWKWNEVSVQFILTKIKCIHQLLDTFDVSCHAWARNQAGDLIKHKKATLPGEAIRLISPGKGTPERAKEFRMRYKEESYSLMGYLPAAPYVTHKTPGFEWIQWSVDPNMPPNTIYYTPTISAGPATSSVITGISTLHDNDGLFDDDSDIPF